MYTLSDSYSYLAECIAHKMVTELECGLAEHGLTIRHFRILMAINQYPRYTQKQLGSLLKYDRTNMVSLLNSLEELKFAQRIVSTKDRRSYTLKLTVKGQKALEDGIYLQEDIEKNILNHLEPLELKILKELLVKANTL